MHAKRYLLCIYFFIFTLIMGLCLINTDSAHAAVSSNDYNSGIKKYSETKSIEWTSTGGDLHIKYKLPVNKRVEDYSVTILLLKKEGDEWKEVKRTTKPPSATWKEVVFSTKNTDIRRGNHFRVTFYIRVPKYYPPANNLQYQIIQKKAGDYVIPHTVRKYDCEHCRSYESGIINYAKNKYFHGFPMVAICVSNINSLSIRELKIMLLLSCF